VPGSGLEPRVELTEISSGVARLFADRLGRGPRKTRALWADGDVLVVLLDIDFTRPEEVMRDGGRVEHVVTARRVLQEMLEADLRAIVEAATARRVRTVLTSARVDPEVSAEIFVLEPLQGA
jgi:uncharacterized protein YbcI